jgi:hypothetical protein
MSTDGPGARPSAEDVAREVDELIDECRSTCLWYQRPDYYPRTDPERWRVLDAIQKHADLATFRRAGRLKEWLSQLSSGAQVRDDTDAALVQWVQDSAYRFFPLIEHATLGLTLHPFDLATNKLLALVGRREVRDWIDVVHCHDVLQPLGYLAWAAAGKDPGLGPLAIIEEAARSVRYTQAEIETLDFDGPVPSAADLSMRWHGAIDGAREIVRALPNDHGGTCVLDHRGELEKATPEALPAELKAGRVAFHEGRIRGAFPDSAFTATLGQSDEHLHPARGEGHRSIGE